MKLIWTIPIFTLDKVKETSIYCFCWFRNSGIGLYQFKESTACLCQYILYYWNCWCCWKHKCNWYFDSRAWKAPNTVAMDSAGIFCPRWCWKPSSQGCGSYRRNYLLKTAGVEGRLVSDILVGRLMGNQLRTMLTHTALRQNVLSWFTMGWLKTTLKSRKRYLSGHPLQRANQILKSLFTWLENLLEEDGLSVLEAFKKLFTSSVVSYAFALVDSQDPEELSTWLRINHTFDWSWTRL